MKPFAPLLLSAALALATSSASGADISAAADIPPAPVARVEPVSDTYFGETLVDPYRWMENAKDPDWLPYMTGQGAHARAVLEALPGRAALLARIQKLSGDSAAIGEFSRAGHRLFYQQRPAGANNFKLFVREGDLRHGHDRLLVDPTTLDTPGHHVSLDWWAASPDGRMLVYGLSSDGSEDSTLHVLNVDTGAQSPERIANTEDANPSWLPDASGFFYNQLTNAVGTPERYLDSKLRFHRLGTDPAADPVVMARGLDPAIAYDRIQMPSIVVPRGSDRALLVLADVRTERRLFVAPLADAVAAKAHWQPVADFTDEVTDFALAGDALYLLAAKGHPRGRVLLTSASHPDLSTAHEVVPESSLVLEEMIRSKDGLYLRAMDGGLGRLERLDIGTGTPRVHHVPLPYDGTLRQVEGDPAEPGVLVQMTGWLKPAAVLAFDAKGRAIDTGLAPQPAIDTRAYTSERRFATAKDGTRIPYDLIYRKGLKRDGHAPTFISAYGSYGSTAYTPAFNARILALVEQGAIVGYAHVRGGGEYGREWHRARTAREQAQHVARPDRRERGHDRPGLHRALAPGHRRTLGGWHHDGPGPHRTPRPVRRRGLGRRLAQPAALCRRTERLRRRARVGRHRYPGRLPRAQGHRQLPGSRRRHEVPGRAAHHRPVRSARRAVPRRQDGRPPAGRHQQRQAHPDARRRRRRPRHRLHPRSGRCRGGGYVCLHSLADGGGCGGAVMIRRRWS